jgi:hypothetical protein
VFALHLLLPVAVFPVIYDKDTHKHFTSHSANGFSGHATAMEKAKRLKQNFAYGFEKYCTFVPTICTAFAYKLS